MTTKNANRNPFWSADNPFSFSRCSLVSLSVPKSKQLTMCRILKPFVKHFEVLGNAVEVVETDQSFVATHFDGAKARIPPYTVTHDQMTSPAISIILFLPEFGKSRAEKLKLKFRKAPWQIHHSIQLQSQKSSNIIGKHEFYFLSRGYPLWSVCTAPQLSRVLRVNVFVRRYSAMVEFYRLVTGSEMESSKPGFCVFTLNTQNYSSNSGTNSFTASSNSKTAHPSKHTAETSRDENVSVELALKYCPHINPFSITDAYLTFPVASIISLRTVIHNYIRPLTSTHYLVHDPDGNPVILYDLSATPTHHDSEPLSKSFSRGEQKGFSSSISCPAPFENTPSSSSINSILFTTIKNKMLSADKTSIRSESWDSGRFSDFDTTSYNTTDLDQCMAKLFPNEKHEDKAFTNQDFAENHNSFNFQDSTFNIDVRDVANIVESLSEYKETDRFYYEEEEEEEQICRIKIGDLSVLEDNKRNLSARDKSVKQRTNKMDKRNMEFDYL